MPREWFDRHAANAIEDPKKKELYISILADKKPRFMIYIYPNLYREYNEFLRNTNKKCTREFFVPLDDLLNKPETDLTDEQKNFVAYYNKFMPVGTGDCVMNKICSKFESEFDWYIKKSREDIPFDYGIMKSGLTYSPSDYKAIGKLCNDYHRRTKDYKIYANRERIDDDEAMSSMLLMQQEFRSACDNICPNSAVLCDIMLDLCYKKGTTKKFVWDMCGKEIISNLLQRNGGIIHYPTKDDNGDIEFNGKKFSMKEKEIEKVYEYNPE